MGNIYIKNWLEDNKSAGLITPHGPKNGPKNGPVHIWGGGGQVNFIGTQRKFSHPSPPSSRCK